MGGVLLDQMPTFQDSAFIFFLALLLFGPKKLPELARYVGKLMAEFRRASNEFRTQMEDELRVADQVEQQKKIAAIEAAAPVAPIVAQNIPEPEHPHLDPVLAPDPPAGVENHIDGRFNGALPAAPISEAATEPESAAEPVPIASSGGLHLMPPTTGLPVARSASSNFQPESQSNSLTGVFDSIPHAPDPPVHEPEPTAHA